MAIRYEIVISVEPAFDNTNTGIEPGMGSAPMTTQEKPVASVKRVTLSIDEACDALGVSRDHFERYIQRDIRVIRVGRRILVRVSELERWAEYHESVGQ